MREQLKITAAIAIFLLSAEEHLASQDQREILDSAGRTAHPDPYPIPISRPDPDTTSHFRMAIESGLKILRDKHDVTIQGYIANGPSINTGPAVSVTCGFLITDRSGRRGIAVYYCMLQQDGGKPTTSLVVHAELDHQPLFDVLSGELKGLRFPDRLESPFYQMGYTTKIFLEPEMGSPLHGILYTHIMWEHETLLGFILSELLSPTLTKRYPGGAKARLPLWVNRLRENGLRADIGDLDEIPIE